MHFLSPHSVSSTPPSMSTAEVTGLDQALGPPGVNQLPISDPSWVRKQKAKNGGKWGPRPCVEYPDGICHPLGSTILMESVASQAAVSCTRKSLPSQQSRDLRDPKWESKGQLLLERQPGVGSLLCCLRICSSQMRPPEASILAYEIQVCGEVMGRRRGLTAPSPFPPSPPHTLWAWQSRCTLVQR